MSSDLPPRHPSPLAARAAEYERLRDSLKRTPSTWILLRKFDTVRKANSTASNIQRGAIRSLEGVRATRRGVEVWVSWPCQCCEEGSFRGAFPDQSGPCLNKTCEHVADKHVFRALAPIAMFDGTPALHDTVVRDHHGCRYRVKKNALFAVTGASTTASFATPHAGLILYPAGALTAGPHPPCTAAWAPEDQGTILLTLHIESRPLTIKIEADSEEGKELADHFELNRDLT